MLSSIASSNSPLILWANSGDGPQEPHLSREFFNSKVGPLESDPFRVQISHSAHPGRAKRGGWSRVSSVEIPRPKRHMFVEDRIPRIFWLGWDDDRRNPRRH